MKWHAFIADDAYLAALRLIPLNKLGEDINVVGSLTFNDLKLMATGPITITPPRPVEHINYIFTITNDEEVTIK